MNVHRAHDFLSSLHPISNSENTALSQSFIQRETFHSNNNSLLSLSRILSHSSRKSHLMISSNQTKSSFNGASGIWTRTSCSINACKPIPLQLSITARAQRVDIVVISRLNRAYCILYWAACYFQIQCSLCSQQLQSTSLVSVYICCVHPDAIIALCFLPSSLHLSPHWIQTGATQRKQRNLARHPGWRILQKCVCAMLLVEWRWRVEREIREPRKTLETILLCCW